MRKYLAGLSRLIVPVVMLTAYCYNYTCLLFSRTTEESQREWVTPTLMVDDLVVVLLLFA